MYDIMKKEIEITLDAETVRNINSIVTFHKIFGIFGIIGGTLSTITIIGAIIGIPYIIIALNFKKAGEFLGNALETKDKEALGNYFIYQKESMKISLILIIISFAAWIILPIFVVIFFAVIITMIKSGL